MKKFIFIALAMLAIIAVSIIFHPAAALASLAVLPAIGKAKMSSRDLERYAEKNFSSFDDDPDGYDDDPNGFDDEEYYTGFDDDFLDFGGQAQSFADNIDMSRKFQITLTNATGNSSTRIAQIGPGLQWVPGGKISSVSGEGAITYTSGPIRDGAFNDKNGSSGLTGAGSPLTIDLFLSYIYAHPTQISAIKISATEAAQIDQIFTERPLDPFRTREENYYMPGTKQDQNTYRDKIITVPTPGLVLCKDKILEYPIVGNATSNVVALTLFAGPSFSTTTAMTRKVSRATRTIQQVGPRNIKKFQSKQRMLSGKGR